MSQTPLEERLTLKVALSQAKGQVQTVDAEGTMNGFTAVNGRGSPTSQTPRAVTVEEVRDGAPVPPRDSSHRSTAESAAHQQPPNGSGYHRSTSPTNGAHKRKRSIVEDDEDDHSSDVSQRSSNSSDESPDVHMQDPSTYSRPGTENAEASWNGQQNEDQAEHLRMLAPIQQDNQQHTNGGYPGSQLPNGHGMRPGYHKDEITGLITTNAGVVMDPKKRKRVSRLC
jgi:hypothetical protein